MAPKRVLAVASIAVGCVLSIFMWNNHFHWFQGGPMGLLLIGLGALELFESRQAGSGQAPRGLVQELRNDIFGLTRHHDPRDNSTDPEVKPRTGRRGDESEES